MLLFEIIRQDFELPYPAPAERVLYECFADKVSFGKQIDCFVDTAARQPCRFHDICQRQFLPAYLHVMQNVQHRKLLDPRLGRFIIERIVQDQSETFCSEREGFPLGIESLRHEL